MNRTAVHWLGHSLVAAAATLLLGCADEGLSGPDRPPSVAQAGAIATQAAAADFSRSVELGACQNLQAPAGSKLAFHTYAEGVQIYHWNGTSWSFDGPSAVLSADAGGRSTVGTHYAGPTWESNSGGKVVGTVLQRCTPDPASIPWLSLAAVPTEGPGVFHRVSFIQRVNTVGGNAPSAPGSFVGEEARVPYTTEYLFYRTK
jgi:hypothetical protein